MENNILETLYEQLKGKYSLLLTNTFSLNAGFDVDFQVICGESELGKFYLYSEYCVEDDYGFNFSVDLPNGEYTHWHPQTKEQALSDVIAFMEGTHRYCL